MPIEAKAQIVIRGGPESLKVLQGVRRGTSDVAKEAKKAAQETERWQKLAWKSADARRLADEKAARATAKAAELAARAQQKAARDTQRVQERAASSAAKAAEKAQRDAVRAAEKAQRDLDKLAQKEMNRWRRMAQQSARYAEQEAAKRISEAKRSAAAEVKARQDAWRKAGGYLTAGAAGLFAGAMSASNMARGVSGVKSVSERITSANEFRERLVRVTSAAGMSPAEREAVQGKVLETSTKRGTDIGALMGVLEGGQGQFGDLKFYAEHLDEIDSMSKAAGADTAEYAKSLGFLRQAFQLTGEEAIEAGFLLKAAADKGSIEAKDFATEFAPVAGLFAQGTGLTGMGGVRQFLGVAQAGGTLGAGAAETATMTERFVSLLSDADKMKELKQKAGIDVKGKTPEQIINEMATSQKFNKPGVMSDIFGSDIIGKKMITALTSARRRVLEGKEGALDIGTIAGVDAEAGRTSVASTIKSMEGEGFFEMQKEAARMQAKTFENLQSYNESILLVARATDRLEEAFGRLAPWAESIASIGVAGALTNLLTRIGGGGGGGGGGGLDLPTVVPTGGGGKGFGNTVAKGLRFGVKALKLYALYKAGEFALTAADDYVKDTTGKSASERAFEHQNPAERDAYETMKLARSGGDPKPASNSSTTASSPAAVGSGVIGAIGQLNRDLGRKLDSVDSGLRAVNTKPPPDAPRGPR